MTPAASAFLIYLWHYLVARLVYDELLRPLVHGHVSVAVALVGGATLAFALVRAGSRILGRRTRRRA